MPPEGLLEGVVVLDGAIGLISVIVVISHGGVERGQGQVVLARDLLQRLPESQVHQDDVGHRDPRACEVWTPPDGRIHEDVGDGNMATVSMQPTSDAMVSPTRQLRASPPPAPPAYETPDLLRTGGHSRTVRPLGISGSPGSYMLT